jgi:hypothetical protein
VVAIPAVATAVAVAVVIAVAVVVAVAVAVVIAVAIVIAVAVVIAVAIAVAVAVVIAVAIADPPASAACTGYLRSRARALTNRTAPARGHVRSSGIAPIGPAVHPLGRRAA